QRPAPESSSCGTALGCVSSPLPGRRACAWLVSLPVASRSNRQSRYPWLLRIPRHCVRLSRRSLRVERFHLPGRTCQVGARLVVAIQGVDLVVVGSRELVLRGDDFDVVGDARPEPVLRLAYALRGEADAEPGSLDFAARRFPLSEG